jgi:OOP family OmpA-OmpF porin
MSPGDERRSGFPKAVWALILAWIVLAILTTAWGVPNEQDDLTSRAEALLSGSGLNVTFNGRDATITGEADQTVIDEAARTIDNLRGVRHVDVSAAQATAQQTTATTAPPPTTTTTTTAAAMAEPSFTASEADGAIDLTGTLPNQETVDSIAAAATAAYGADNVANQLQVGNVTEPAYLGNLARIFDIAGGLDPWKFSLANGQAAFSGMGPDRATVAAKRSAFDTYRQTVPFAGSGFTLEVDPAAVAATLTQLLAGGANFETGSAVLSADAKIKLDQVVEIMMENPSTVLTVEGHTDNQGDPASNQVLSESRAQAVVDYLVAGGIAADRLTAIGYGEDRPIASNDTPEGRAKNRRIEFVVTEGE